MKKCPEKKLLVRFIDQDLQADERKNLSLHLESCKDCSAEIEKLKSFDNQLRQDFSILTSNVSFSENVIARIKSEPLPPHRVTSLKPLFAHPIFSFLKPLLALSIIIVALVGLFSIFGRNQNSAYRGTTFAALSEGASVGSSCVSPGFEQQLPEMFPVEICGKFIFVVHENASASFQANGRAKIIGAKKGLPVFDESSADFAWVSGSKIVLSVNSREVSIEPVFTRITQPVNELADNFSELEQKFYEILNLAEEFYEDCDVYEVKADYESNAGVLSGSPLIASDSEETVNNNDSTNHKDPDSATMTDLSREPGKSPFDEDTLELGGN